MRPAKAQVQQTRCPHCFTRRAGLLSIAGACAVSIAPTAFATIASANLPTEVAGVAIPRSAIAVRAASLSRSACPDFLFNHCMRTFVFGALALNTHNIAYNADQAFVGAALHDLGLLPAYESANGSFEMDGANAAETFARESGLDVSAADIIWHCVAMHDTRFARRQGPEALLVAVGAGSDVDGPSPSITAAQVTEVVAAFPRLQFKTRFTSLLVDHCRRKRESQDGTWLADLCRENGPPTQPGAVQREIAQSPFAE